MPEVREACKHVSHVRGIGRRRAQFVDDRQEIVQGANGLEDWGVLRAAEAAHRCDGKGGADDFKRQVLGGKGAGQDAIRGPGPGRGIWEVEVGPDDLGDEEVHRGRWLGRTHLRRRRVSASRWLSKVR